MNKWLIPIIWQLIIGFRSMNFDMPFQNSIERSQDQKSFF